MKEIEVEDEYNFEIRNINNHHKKLKKFTRTVEVTVSKFEILKGNL